MYLALKETSADGKLPGAEVSPHEEAVQWVSFSHNALETPCAAFDET